MSSALQQLILDVSNLDHSIHFYADLLKLELRSESNVDGVRVANFRAGAANMLLVQRPGLGAFDRTGGVVLNFDVSSLSDMLTRISRFGVGVLRDVEISSKGESSVLVSDPDGYAVLLSETARLIH